MVAFTAFVQWILFFCWLARWPAFRRDCRWALTCCKRAMQSKSMSSARSAKADLQGGIGGAGKLVDIDPPKPVLGPSHHARDDDGRNETKGRGLDIDRRSHLARGCARNNRKNRGIPDKGGSSLGIASR